MFLPIMKKSTDEVIEAFTTELISRKDECQVLDMENIMNNINPFPEDQGCSRSSESGHNTFEISSGK